MRIRFRILSGQRIGQQPQVPESGGLIGRDQRHAVYLPDRGVFPEHAQLGADSKGFWVRDMGSQSGTLVDGRQLNPLVQCYLPQHGKLKVGDVNLEFWVEQEAVPARPSAATPRPVPLKQTPETLIINQLDRRPEKAPQTVVAGERVVPNRASEPGAELFILQARFDDLSAAHRRSQSEASLWQKRAQELEQKLAETTAAVKSSAEGGEVRFKLQQSQKFLEEFGQCLAELDQALASGDVEHGRKLASRMAARKANLHFALEEALRSLGPAP